MTLALTLERTTAPKDSMA
ncbi:predicted protein [Streptomyces iranensis]|uniref:Uncharacterized protein n=1 Tax=Streptomyces iranensis TaxID=576784 RepID=A0A060ZC31_9ACTN|nr:predicted protein [Streptomyces iranensis]